MKKEQPIKETTISKSEYFSWINNTNEGSSEANTMANLDFFKYLHDNYSMTLDIYTLDAGNLDSPGSSYEYLDSPKLKKQFPNGYSPMVNKAREINTRFGIWGGPDGYGDNKTEAKKRHDDLVRLAKDYNFALFKFDAVCGELKDKNRKYFEKTINDCWKYSKDLILTTHRINLGKASYLQSTFLWEGLETYTDVHCYNKICAPHNRAYIFNRGYTPELKRLTEDHGVCISSSVDYFEDDLIYQAFNRCLILSPQIYGNPWFIRDDELPMFAHIFNMHRKYRNILINGFIPTEIDLGDNPIIRGTTDHRLISTGNASWNKKTITIPLNEKIGLKTDKKIACIIKFPYEEFIGTFDYNDTINIELEPFRASLIELVTIDALDNIIINAKYQVEKEDFEYNIKKVKILKANGPIYYLKKDNKQLLSNIEVDDIENNPLYISSLDEKEVPNNSEELYENIYFNLENESLEKRCIYRSGESNIEEVNKCRNFFFNQDSYNTRGLDSKIPFDGNKDTIFDTKSVSYINHNNRKGFRVLGGTLRIDLGDIYEFDTLEIEYFKKDKPDSYMFSENDPKDNYESSIDLKVWVKGDLIENVKVEDVSQPVYAYYSDNYQYEKGNRMKVVYKTNTTKACYIRLPEQVDRIYTIKLFNNGDEIKPANPHLNFLFAPYYKRSTKHYFEKEITLESNNKYPYLSIAVNGYVGYENVCVGIIIDGKIYPAPRRAPEYPANAFEYPVHPVDSNYTFFIPIKKEWLNKKVKLFALIGEDSNIIDIPRIDVYMCDEHKKREGIILELD